MRKGLFAPLAVLTIGVRLAWGQGPAGVAEPPPPLPDVVDAAPAVPDGGPVAPAWHFPAAEGRVWVNAEYLLWWLKRSPMPVPLITTTTDLTSQPPAALGLPGTSVLLGNDELDTGARHGARLGAGLWIDDHRTVGIEAGYFFLASRTVRQGLSSPGQEGSPVLAVPFFDADAGVENTFLLASPGFSSGGATLTLTSRLQGAEANGVVAALARPGLRVCVLAGFRYIELLENLTFTTTTFGIQDPTLEGSNNGLVLSTQDQFDARNEFYGWQVGVRGDYQAGGLSVSAFAKVAVGEVYQAVTVNGSSVTNFFSAPPGGPFAGAPVQVVPQSGTFAQPSNVVGANRHQFDWAPEFGVSVGYQVTGGLRVSVGYDFLYLSNVARPGNQIDRSINLSQTVQAATAGSAPAPGTHPAPLVAGSEFWAQGLSLGLEYRY
jgi:hypothetical protein